MSPVKVTVEHNGETYGGEIMTIESTSFGGGDRGIATAYLHCRGASSGIGVGGYCLDTPVKDADGKTKRVGTAYGLDHLLTLMETVGVERWEDLPGKQVVVLFRGRSLIGASSIGIAGLQNGKVMILEQHAKDWRVSDGAA